MAKRTVIECDLKSCGKLADIGHDLGVMFHVPDWIVVDEMLAEPSYAGQRLTFCSWQHLTLYGVEKKDEV